MKERKVAYMLFIFSILWTIVIFVACTIPTNTLPGLKIQHADKAAHFGVFFVQSVLLSLLLRFRTGKRYFQIILFSTLFAFVYGGVIEILQRNFFNRSGELDDLIADMMGGFLGATVYPVVFRILNQFRKST